MSTPTARQFALATETDLGGPAQYATFCARVGLPPVPGGYGMVMVESADGARQTFVTEDVEYVRVMAAGAKTPGLLGGLQIPPGKFPLIRDGWVDEWTA